MAANPWKSSKCSWNQDTEGGGMHRKRKFLSGFKRKVGTQHRLPDSLPCPELPGFGKRDGIDPDQDCPAE